MNIDKKLDEILDDFKIWEHWVENGVQKHNQIQPDKAKQEIKQLFQELIEEVIGKDEYRETEDMSLSSWTNEDYKAFGRNELRNDIRQRAKELLEKM